MNKKTSNTRISGYPTCDRGPINLESPADSGQNECSYYVEETSFFPYSCASSNECTGMNNHSVPFDTIEHVPYQELYPYLPPKP